MAPLLRMSVSGAGKLLEDRPREVVAAAGRERDLDAGVDRARNGVAVRRGNCAVAVEEGAVDVEGEEADHSGFGNSVAR